MKQTSLEQPQLITSLERLAELDRNWKNAQNCARTAWTRGAHVTARTLTQLSILAMAALSVSPVLSPLAIQLGPGPGAYRLQISALMLLSALALASFVLTGRLRKRLQAI